MKILSCCSKPVRPLFIFGIQIKIFDEICRFGWFRKTIRHENNTVRQTVWAVNCFKTWLAEKQLSINLKHREITNELSVVGFLWLRSDQLGGTLCYLSLWAVLNRHINEPPLSRSWNLMQDPEFVSIVKQIRWSGRDRTSHYPPISSEDQQILNDLLH